MLPRLPEIDYSGRKPDESAILVIIEVDIQNYQEFFQASRNSFSSTPSDTEQSICRLTQHEKLIEHLSIHWGTLCAEFFEKEGENPTSMSKYFQLLCLILSDIKSIRGTLKAAEDRCEQLRSQFKNLSIIFYSTWLNYGDNPMFFDAKQLAAECMQLYFDYAIIRKLPENNIKQVQQWLEEISESKKSELLENDREYIFELLEFCKQELGKTSVVGQLTEQGTFPCVSKTSLEEQEQAPLLADPNLAPTITQRPGFSASSD